MDAHYIRCGEYLQFRIFMLYGQDTASYMARLLYPFSLACSVCLTRPIYLWADCVPSAPSGLGGMEPL